MRVVVVVAPRAGGRGAYSIRIKISFASLLAECDFNWTFLNPVRIPLLAEPTDWPGQGNQANKSQDLIKRYYNLVLLDLVCC